VDHAVAVKPVVATTRCATPVGPWSQKERYDRRSQGSRNAMPLSTIGRALAELADSWTLLILQRAFLGVRRFAGWRDALGISDSVLAGRLREMTAACLLEARPYRDGGRPRSEYRLTPRGLDLWSL